MFDKFVIVWPAFDVLPTLREARGKENILYIQYTKLCGWKLRSVINFPLFVVSFPFFASTFYIFLVFLPVVSDLFCFIYWEAKFAFSKGDTVYKASKFGVFLVRTFPHSEWRQSIQSEYGKTQIRKLRIWMLFTKCDIWNEVIVLKCFFEGN